MATIVGVHGIAQQFKNAETLLQEWEPAMVGSVAMAGSALERGQLVCAFYGDLFRPPDVTRANGVEHEEADIDADDAELLQVLWEHAAAVEPTRVVSPDDEEMRGVPRSIQAALMALANSKALGRLATSAFIGALKQVTAYLREPGIRTAAQDAVDAVVTEDTRILVGHSLGSVVAYESLIRFKDHHRWRNVSTLVTLGSPLGIPNVIFDRLDPTPAQGRGVHPGVDRWINISDDGDVVALQKRLEPLFGVPLVDIRVHNGADSHSIEPYLTAKATGKVIADGLCDQ